MIILGMETVLPQNLLKVKFLQEHGSNTLKKIKMTSYWT